MGSLVTPMCSHLLAASRGKQAGSACGTHSVPAARSSAVRPLTSAPLSFLLKPEEFSLEFLPASVLFRWVSPSAPYWVCPTWLWKEWDEVHELRVSSAQWSLTCPLDFWKHGFPSSPSCLQSNKPLSNLLLRCWHGLTGKCYSSYIFKSKAKLMK